MHEPAKQKLQNPWPVFITVGVAFLLIEHSLDAQRIFQAGIASGALSQFDTARAVFQPGARRFIGAILLGLLGVWGFMNRSRMRSWHLGMYGIVFLVFVFWALCSVLWSEVPSLTLRRGITLLLLVAGADALARVSDARQLCTFVWSYCGLVILLGLGAEFLQQTFVPWEEGYRFAGTMHPNMQGVNSALFILASIGLLMNQSRHRVILLLGMGIAIMVLYLTKSRTALAALVLAIVIVWAMSRSPGKQIMVVCVGLAGFFAVLLFSDLLLPLFTDTIAMGRSDNPESLTTLTGRVPLWTQCWALAQNHILMGHGYGAFWTEDHAWEVSIEQGWPVFAGHNAYMDYLLELGIIGLGVYLALLVTGFFMSQYRSGVNADPGIRFYAQLICLFSLHGFFESVTAQRSYQTFLLLTVFISLAFYKHRKSDEA